MSTTLHVYTIINNPIFSGGIENLIQTKIVPEAKIIRMENLEALINRDKLPDQNNNNAELLIYDVVKFTNKDFNRSEEHTSELQSRPHLVCRLLLDKKNIIVSYGSER